jgi:hypothetical protein
MDTPLPFSQNTFCIREFVFQFWFGSLEIRKDELLEDEFGAAPGIVQPECRTLFAHCLTTYVVISVTWAR